MRNLVVPALVLWLSLASGAILSVPEPYGFFRPTTCSGAFWEPPKMAGTYNLSIVDKCTKNTHAVSVTVQCPERIPAANFSLTISNIGIVGTASSPGATFTLNGQVCTERSLGHRWTRTRRPRTDVTSAHSIASLSHTDNDVLKSSTMTISSITDPGIYQYSWEVYDGCNMYMYNTSVHYDGQTVVLLPPHSLLGYENPNPRCASDTPFVKFEKNSKEVVYRVDHADNTIHNSGYYDGSISKFKTETVKVINTLADHMNAIAASQVVTSYDWHVTPDENHVIIDFTAPTSIRKEYIIAPRGAFPGFSALPAEVNFTALFGHLPQYSDGGFSEWESSDDTVGSWYAYYPINRANATFNTPTHSERATSEAYYYRFGNSTREFYNPAKMIKKIKSTILAASKVPLCQVTISSAKTGLSNSYSLRYNQIKVDFNPLETNQFDEANPLIKHSACVGTYNLTVVAKNGPNCTAAATQFLHVSCGFAPDVRLSPAVQRSVRYSYTPSAHAFVELRALAIDPFNRPITYTWEVIQKPQDASIISPSFPSAGQYTFRATHPGAYVVNVTVSNGCSATSVLEYVEVSCTSTEKPTLTVDDFPAGSDVFTGIRGNKNAVFNQATALTGTNGVNYVHTVTARILTGPTPLARDTAPGQVSVSSSTSPSGTVQFNPYGAGTYSIQVNSTHGCGQVTTVTKQFTQTCSPTITVVASHTQSDVVITDANYRPEEDGYRSITLETSANNAYTHTYTFPPTLRHTWELQSINDTAVTDTQKGILNFGNTYTTTTASTAASVTRSINVNDFGKFVYKYWMDDGCAQKTGTHTVSVVCPAPSVTLTASASSINARDTLTLTPDFGSTSVQSRSKCEIIHTFGGKETIYIRSSCNSSPAYSVNTYYLASGSHSFKYRVTNRCGRTTTSEAVTVTVTCPVLTSVVETHARETNKDALTSVTFTNGRFPSIVVNGSKSKAGEDDYDMAWMDVVVKSAPAGSIYAEFYDEYSYDDGVSSFCNSVLEDEAVETCFSGISSHWKDVWAVRTRLEAYQPWVTLTPDVAGTYELEVLVSNDCSEKKQTITLTANCPAGDSKAVITNDKGVELATSASTAIPGVSFTIQSQASNILILNGTNSVVSGSSKNLFYHWYWESPARNPDSPWEYDAYNHDGLLTPYAPVLSIDPKMYPFNNRPLYLTVSDGCSRVTTAVRVNTACAGPTINLQVDKTTIFYDPAKECPQCPLHFRVHAGGVCVDGLNDWMEDPVGQTYASGAITANDAFMQAFPVSTGDDDDNEKLAIGLGVGLGLLFLIIVAVVLCMFYRKSNSKSQVLPSSAAAGTGSVESA